MIRNLKTLGLALVAVLALGALVASSASAVGKFTSPVGYPQHVVGEDIGAGDIFTAGAEMQVACSGETYTATLNASTSALTVTPTFKDCTTPGGEFTILMNSCQFELTVTETVTADHDKGQMHVRCPTGLIMETHQFAGPQQHASNMSNCKITTGPQTGTGSLHYTSETGSKDLQVHGQIELSGQFHGACSFGFTINTNFTFHLSLTLKATSGAAIHVG